MKWLSKKNVHMVITHIFSFNFDDYPYLHIGSKSEFSARENMTKSSKITKFGEKMAIEKN